MSFSSTQTASETTVLGQASASHILPPTWTVNPIQSKANSLVPGRSPTLLVPFLHVFQLIIQYKPQQQSSQEWFHDNRVQRLTPASLPESTLTWLKLCGNKPKRPDPLLTPLGSCFGGKQQFKQTWPLVCSSALCHCSDIQVRLLVRNQRVKAESLGVWGFGGSFVCSVFVIHKNATACLSSFSSRYYLSTWLRAGGAKEKPGAGLASAVWSFGSWAVTLRNQRVCISLCATSACTSDMVCVLSDYKYPTKAV